MVTEAIRLSIQRNSTESHNRESSFTMDFENSDDDGYFNTLDFESQKVSAHAEYDRGNFDEDDGDADDESYEAEKVKLSDQKRKNNCEVRRSANRGNLDGGGTSIPSSEPRKRKPYVIEDDDDEADESDEPERIKLSDHRKKNKKKCGVEDENEQGKSNRKRRRKWSDVWEDFKVITKVDKFGKSVEKAV